MVTLRLHTCLFVAHPLQIRLDRGLGGGVLVRCDPAEPTGQLRGGAEG